jgi:hypothetical protein
MKNSTIYILFIVLLIASSACQKNDGKQKEIDEKIQKALLRELSAPDEMRTLAEEIQKKSDSLNYTQGIAYAYLLKAKYLKQQKKINQALDTLFIAEKKFQTINDRQGEALVFNEILMNIKFNEKDEKTDKIRKAKLPDTCRLNKLLNYSVALNSYFIDNIRGTDIIRKKDTIQYIIKDLSNSNPGKNSYEEMLQNQLLAMLYYTLSANYYDKSNSSPDSAIFYYKKSAEYDKILNNKQAWSFFTVADKYLTEKFKPEKKDSAMLDSAFAYLKTAVRIISDKEDVNKENISGILLEYPEKNELFKFQAAHLHRLLATYFLYTDDNEGAILHFEKYQDLFPIDETLPHQYYEIHQKYERQKTKTHLLYALTGLGGLAFVLLIVSILHIRTLKEKILLNKSIANLKLEKEAKKLEIKALEKNNELLLKNNKFLGRENQTLANEKKDLVRDIEILNQNKSMQEIIDSLRGMAMSPGKDSKELYDKFCEYEKQLDELPFFKNMKSQLSTPLYHIVHYLCISSNFTADEITALSNLFKRYYYQSPESVRVNIFRLKKALLDEPILDENDKKELRKSTKEKNGFPVFLQEKMNRALKNPDSKLT